MGSHVVLYLGLLDFSLNSPQKNLFIVKSWARPGLVSEIAERYEFKFYTVVNRNTVQILIKLKSLVNIKPEMTQLNF